MRLERARLEELAIRQQRTLEALRVSEERFRALADSAVTPIITVDESDVIRFANPATAATFGYDDSESLIGRHLTDLMPERFRDRHLRGLARFMRTGERVVPWSGVELMGLHASGHEIPLWVSFGTFEHRGERHFTGIMLDLSARFAAEQALRTSEEHYRRLVTTSPYAVYVLDLEGRFSEVNIAAEAILQRSAADVLGMHFTEVLTTDARDEIVAVFAQFVQGDLERYETEVPIVRPSGEIRLVHIAASRIDIGGVPTGVHGIASDVTEERARDSQRRMLAAALDNLPDAVALATLDGRYLYTNAAYGELLRFRPDRLPSTIHELVPDEEAAAQLERIFVEIRSSGRWAGRARRRRGDGSVLDVSLLAAIVPLEPAFLFIVMRDATEEIAREEHVRRVERLASIGTLIGGVAHELNNPLTAIVGFSHLMLADERTDEDLETLGMMAREAERAARIVADLRLLARNTQEQKRIDAVDLADVTRHVIKVRSYSLHTRSIEIVDRLTEGLPPVRGNRAELEQVVLNLVVNAEQALAQSENRPLRLALSSRLAANRVVLQVSDNGPGIPRDILPRIFDPFFTTKSPGEGTGLGLSLAHRIVEEHGGSMRVASEAGHGARFTIELPRYEGAEPPQAPRKQPPAEAALRVLIIDDEASIRSFMTRLLSARGHVVTDAGDGAAALGILERESRMFDVIISDMRMPGLDGAAFLDRLRVISPEVVGRVMLVTGDPGAADSLRSDLSGVGDVVMKPFAIDEFVRRVERLGRSRPGDANA